MLGYADLEALRRTMADGRVWFYSRSRETYWRKGETSGNELILESLHTDCDADAVLALVSPAGPTCHTGSRSCFETAPTLPGLADVIEARRVAQGGADDDASGRRDARPSYTQRLLADRNLRLKKLGEEAVELALACADADGVRCAEEAADLMYHALVACASEGVSLDDVLRVLQSRRGDGPPRS
jgi:phosphoribosyl-ATP pyrophosphohydrolase/phosphoribosyl-AMP cyclohydrolase